MILEDDTLFAETIEDFLESEGFEVTLTHSADEAHNSTAKERFDLMVLDINLPDSSGIEFLKEHRQTQNATPALFITSHTEKKKLIEAFGAGADDYMNKPIDLDELLLRVNALLRRGTLLSSIVELKGGLSFDLVRSVLLKGTEEQDLPKMCMKMLSLLVKNIGKTVTMSMIEDELYSMDEYASYGSIRVYVNQIKKAIYPNEITNLRGIGYRLEKP